MFRVYIAGVSETQTDSPRVARAAFQELLSRDDLIGEPSCAVLERDGEPVYSSRFDAPLAAGRLHPEAPIDVYASVAAAAAVQAWRPYAC